MSQFNHVISGLHSAIAKVQPLELRGRVTNVVGTIIRAIVPGAQIGELCYLDSIGAPLLLAEVVGFQENEALLTPMGDMLGVSTSTEVITTGKSHHISVGPHLLGRVLDGMGNPIDGLSEEFPSDLPLYPVYADAPSPMTRRMISEPLSLGVH